MGCFDDCLTGMMEPYGGNTPLFNSNTTDATVTIVQESYDGGTKVTRIQTPPRTETGVLMEAINNILGYMDMSCMMDTCPTSDEECPKTDEPSDKKEKPESNLKQSFGSKQDGYNSNNKKDEEKGDSHGSDV